MIKMVASDLDGTLLLNKAQSLPEEIFPLIRKLKEMGILFVAASGRQYPNMKRMFAPVASEIAYISETGHLLLTRKKFCIRIPLTERWQLKSSKRSLEKRTRNLPALPKIITT